MVDLSNAFSSPNHRAGDQTITSTRLVAPTIARAHDNRLWASAILDGTPSATVRHPKPLSALSGFRFLWASFRGRTHHFLTKLMRKYGDAFIIWNQYVILTDVDAIRDVLEKHNLEKTPQGKKGYRFLFGTSILSAPWIQWKKQRRMMAPALAEAVIGELAPKFRLGMEPILDMLEEIVANPAEHNQVVEMDQAFTAVTLDTIGLILLGRSFGLGSHLTDKSRSELPFSNALDVLTIETIRQMTLPSRILQIFPPGRKVRRARVIVDSFIDDCVQARIQERLKGGQNDTNMMNILLDAEENGLINREAVNGQLLTFLFAGHDTTAHTLSWLLYEVSLNQTLQEDLYDEAKAALPSRTDFPTDPAIISKQLPLLDRVWKETNRKHPAAATGTLRKVGRRSLIVGDGLELPARSSVLIPAYPLHRNEKYWPNSEVFDPSRFDPASEAVATRDPMAFQAFSSGPRNCIGARLARAETLTIMAPLLRRFKVTCAERNEPADICSLTRRPKNGIRFRFTARE